MNSGDSGERRLSGAAAADARDAVRYMLERDRARSRGEAVPSLPTVASGIASALANKRRARAPVFKVPSGQTLGKRFFAARYRAWWSRNLPTPYGLCACGCRGRTPRAGWTSRERGFVSGEPLTFLPHHRKRYGYPALTNPDRRCACGCSTPTSVVRDTATDEAGIPYQFAGMRSKWLNNDHRPPPALPGLTLKTSLGASREVELSEKERGWLAGVLSAHGSFARDRGKIRPKLQSTDADLIQRFLKTIGRGRVDVSQPARKGASPVWKWTGRSSLEAANVLYNLYDLLLPETREQARTFLEDMELPIPNVTPSAGREGVQAG